MRAVDSEAANRISAGCVKKICKGADVESGLSIHGAEAANSRGKVESWVRKMA